MHWRLKQSEYDKQKGSGNRRAMKKLIESGKPPGIIGYLNKEPVAWCCVGPRKDFSKLERSRILKPIDDKPVWSILCLFVAKSFRNAGLSSQVVEAAADYAFSKGALVVEGFLMRRAKTNGPTRLCLSGWRHHLRKRDLRL